MKEKRCFDVVLLDAYLPKWITWVCAILGAIIVGVTAILAFPKWLLRKLRRH